MIGLGVFGGDQYECARERVDMLSWQDSPAAAAMMSSLRLVAANRRHLCALRLRSRDRKSVGPRPLQSLRGGAFLGSDDFLRL